MATHSNILAWEIRRREEPGGLQSKRVGCDLAAKEQPQYCIVNYKYYAGLPVSRTYSSCSTETFYSFKHNSSFCPPVLLAPGNHSILLLLLLSRFSRVRLCATPWTVAHKGPLSMGFPRQEYWSGWPSPSPEDLPNPGIEPRSPSLPPGKPSLEKFRVQNCCLQMR